MAASQSDSSAAETPCKPGLLVLDTNVVLDLLVFANPAVKALTQALESGAMLWAACPRMRGELERTLGYAAVQAWNPDSERTLSFFDRLSLISPDPPRPQSSPLLCSDPDDQVFVELALARNAGWLLTRDRALLKLRRRAASRGLRIVPPEVWVAAQGPAPAPP